MSDIREKLVELLHGAQKAWGDYMSEWWTDGERPMKDYWGIFADHLIANGVTVQEWIPVTARFPAKDTEVLCFKGRYIGTLMDVYTYVGNCKWEDTYGNRSCTEDEGITHWMPIPQPPKGE